MHIVAELSGNHGGSLIRCLELMHLAVESGATLIKVQLYNPEKLAAKRALHPVTAGTGEEELRKLYCKSVTPREWFKIIARHSEDLRVPWFASVFEPADAAVIADLGAWGIKLASFEIGDEDLLGAAAATQLPVVLSCGSSTPWAIVLKAMTICPDATLLHATEYQVSARDSGLRRFLVAKRRGPLVGLRAVGLSDHTIGPATAIAATALGAVMIEKHFREANGPRTADTGFSASPAEFALMAQACKEIEAALSTKDEAEWT